MGLASALSTALTGLTGSETTIDVVGNNLANSNTVGFKASTATFATQFLQTYSLGSGPTTNDGGTNPRQIGLGTMVSSIQANFSEGTISNTSLVSDMAIQGNGFFIIQASDGSYAYTRDGEFTLNSQNQLVTASGNMVLGYAVDNNFNIQKAALEPLTIPFGTKMVAEATQNVALNGTLPPPGPTGGIADTAQVIDTDPLGDDTKTFPDAATAAATNAADVGTVSTTDGGAATGNIQAGNYSYKLVYSKVDGSDPYSESVPSSDNVAGTVAANNSSLVINNLFSIKASATTAGYQYVNIYRAPVAAGGTVGAYGYIDSVNTNDITDASYTYTDTAATGGSNLDDDMLTGTYGYYISFYNSVDGKTSDPVAITDGSGSKSIAAANQRIEIALPPAETASGDWDSWAIYRNTVADKNTFHEVNTIKFNTGAASYIDSSSDDSIKGNSTLNMIGTGSEISDMTLLTDVIKYDASNFDYKHVFTLGALNFTDKKGTEELNRSFTITASSTVGDLLTFLNQSLGIQTGGGIPVSKNTADPSNPYTPGANNRR